MVLQKSERSRSGGHRRIMPIVSHRVRCKDHNYRAWDLLSNASLVEVIKFEPLLVNFPEIPLVWACNWAVSLSSTYRI